MSPTGTLSRRSFLAAGAAAVGGGGNWAVAGPAADDAWALPVLGDLHLDRPEHHDAEWLKATHPNDVRQVENYCRVTREFTPKLFATVKAQVAAATHPVPFVLQLGDLIEGLCGSDRLAAVQAGYATGFVQGAGLPVPFLFTKGNHDVAGPGAADAYNAVLVPFLAKQAGEGVARAAFARRQGGWLVVFYDAYDRGSLDWFDGLLREQKPDRVLFLIHPPVVPFNARSTWHVYSSPGQARQRERLLGLLGRAHAVVLCGHLHKFCHLVRRTADGWFTQLAVSSVATDPEGKPKDLLEGKEHYGPALVRLEPNHSPDTAERRRAVLAEEARHVDRYAYADTWGHAVLTVRGRSATAAVYRGLDRDRPWRSLDLTAPPG